MLADLEQQAVSARQQWRVHSADLTQVLRLDPRAVVEPLEHDHVQITLIDPGRSLDDLMPVALTNRPELASRQALVKAAEVAIRREKARPLIPNVVLNGFQTPFEMLQAGIFGFGPNSSLNQWVGRDDFSIQPLWQLQNLGFGNLALIKRQRGMESLAIIEFFEAQDMVAAEVNQALARRPVGGGPGRPGRSRPAHGHHHLQRDLRGPGADQPFRRRPGPDQPAAGGGLRAPALERGLRRVLHDGRRVQPGAVRAVPRAGLPGQRGRVAAAARRGPCRWTRRGRPTCPRWATGRPRPPDERRPSSERTSRDSHRTECQRMRHDRRRPVWTDWMLIDDRLAMARDRDLRCSAGSSASRRPVATPATDPRPTREALACAASGAAAVDSLPRHRTLHETERPGPAPAARPRRSHRHRAARSTAAAGTCRPTAAAVSPGRPSRVEPCRRPSPPPSPAPSPAGGAARSPLADHVKLEPRAVRSRPTSGSRSTWPPPCGSPTPGR